MLARSVGRRAEDKPGPVLFICSSLFSPLEAPRLQLLPFLSYRSWKRRSSSFSGRNSGCNCKLYRPRLRMGVASISSQLNCFQSLYDLTQGNPRFKAEKIMRHPFDDLIKAISNGWMCTMIRSFALWCCKKNEATLPFSDTATLSLLGTLSHSAEGHWKE